MSRRKRPNWPYRWTLLALAGLMTLYIGVQTVIGGMTFARRPTEVDWSLALVSSLLDATIACWFVAVGASIGSFLNVVAYRVPRKLGLGGGSKCPHCQTPIDARDNIPVLAWVRLRGRCRNCRLPISAHYPRVELAMAIVFFVVYASEFFSGGGNLPGVQGIPLGAGGLTRISGTSTMMLRLVVYLFALSGLFGAALIAAHGRVVPLSLYGWSLIPLFLVTLFRPDTVIVAWRAAQLDGPIDTRLDSMASLLCGLATGIAVARLVAPAVYRGFDRTFMASDSATAGARQFVGAMAVAGAVVGWQAVLPMGWVTIGSATLIGIALRFARGRPCFFDLTLFVWLGLLVFRAFWKPLSASWLYPSLLPPVIHYIISALLLAGFSSLVRRVVFGMDTQQQSECGTS